jgi:hypothetical protein
MKEKESVWVATDSEYPVTLMPHENPIPVSDILQFIDESEVHREFSQAVDPTDAFELTCVSPRLDTYSTAE